LIAVDVEQKNTQCTGVQKTVAISPAFRSPGITISGATTLVVSSVPYA
jgi:hypothetical protein